MIFSFLLKVRDEKKEFVDLVVKYLVTKEDVAVFDGPEFYYEKRDCLQMERKYLSATKEGKHFEISEEDFEDWENEIWKAIEKNYNEYRWAA